MNRIVFLSVFAFAGLVGCTVSDDLDADSVPEAVQAQSNVVRISAEEIAAIEPGKFLRLDVTAHDVVYDVDFFSVADLDRVLVVGASGEFKLSEKAPPVKQGERGRLVIGANANLAQEHVSSLDAPSARPSAGGDVGEAAQALRARCIDVYDFGDVIIIVVYDC
jgi:hypothetical protein